MRHSIQVVQIFDSLDVFERKEAQAEERKKGSMRN